MQNDKVLVEGKISQVYADGAVLQSSNSDTKIYLPNEVLPDPSLGFQRDDELVCDIEPSTGFFEFRLIPELHKSLVQERDPAFVSCRATLVYRLTRHGRTLVDENGTSNLDEVSTPPVGKSHPKPKFFDHPIYGLMEISDSSEDDDSRETRELLMSRPAPQHVCGNPVNSAQGMPNSSVYTSEVQSATFLESGKADKAESSHSDCNRREHVSSGPVSFHLDPSADTKELTLIEMGFSSEQARRAIEDSGGDLDEAVELLMNGNSDGRSGGRVLDIICDLLKKKGGQLLVSELLARVCEMEPAARTEIPEAGGMKGYCARHDDILEFVQNKAAGIVRLRAVGKHTYTQLSPPTFLGHGQTRITGVITKVHGRCAFMESSPGVTDVFIPESAYSRWKPGLKVGERISVAAVEHLKGRNKWRAGHLLADGELSLRATDVCDGAGQQRFMGMVTNSHKGSLFMESSAGNSDVFIPQHVVAEYGSSTICVGSLLTVDVVENEVGKNKWRAVKIVSNDSFGGGSAMTKDCKPGVSQHAMGDPSGSNRGHTRVPEHGAAAASNPPHGQSHQIVPAGGIPPTNPEGPGTDVNADSGFGEHRNDANMDTAEWNGTQDWSVINCLLALVRKRGFLSGADLSLLYKRHPEAAQEVRAAGGLRAFCKQHAEDVEFVEDGCSGRVIIRKDSAVTELVHAHIQPNTASRGAGGAALNAFALLQPNDAGSSDESSDEQSGCSESHPADESVSELASMGFEVTLAMDALHHVGGDVQRAIEWMYTVNEDGRSNADAIRESKSQLAGPHPPAPAVPKTRTVAKTVAGVTGAPVTSASARAKANDIDHRQQARQLKQAGNIHFLQGRHKAAQDEYTLSLFHYSEVPHCRRSQDLLREVGEAHLLRAIACFQIGSFLETVSDCVAAVEHNVPVAQVTSLQAWARLRLCEARIHQKNASKEMWKAELAEIDLSLKDTDVSQLVDHSPLFGANSRPECFFEMGPDYYRRLHSNKEILEDLLQIRNEHSASARESGPSEAFPKARTNAHNENSAGAEPLAAAALRVICLNPLCHTILVMHYDKELHRSWGSTPCRVCGRQYPWYLFPELAQEGLPDCIQVVWNRAKQSLSERHIDNGEIFVEEARLAAVRKGLDQVPKDDVRYPCIYDRTCDKGWGCEVPSKLHSGTKLLLSHCIRLRDREMLKYLTQFPVRLESESQNDLPLLFENWISRCGSWVWYFLQGGGLELAMDSDDQFSATVKDRLVYTLFSSMICLANQCQKKCCTKHIDNFFYGPLLEEVLNIPELTSPGRIDLAVRVLKGLKILENPPKSSLFSTFLCKKIGFEGWSIMSLACFTRRFDLISAMLDIAPHLVHCEGVGSFLPLHTVCSLPPLSFCPPVFASFPHYKKALDFTCYGFQWQLQVSKGDSGARSKQLKVPLNRGKTSKVDQLDFNQVPTSSLIVHLSLENASTFPAALTFSVNVKLEINIYGSDILSVHCCSFGYRRIRSDPLEIQLSGLIENKSSSLKDARVQLTINSITPQGAGLRCLRDSDRCLLEQRKIVEMLLLKGADKDSYTNSGRNAFSLALDSRLPEKICDIVFPCDFPRAINAALSGKDLDLQEFTALLEKAPADLDVSEIQISGLVAKIARYQPEDLVHSYLLQMLEWFLKLGPGQAEVESALRGAFDTKDWITVDMILRCAPAIPNAKALAVHDIIVSSRPELLRVLLEAGASANTLRNNLKVDGETPLHVAARFGNFECIQILLEYKGDCNLKERKSGNTALHEAASILTGEGGERIIQLMLQSGADPTILNARKSNSVGCAKDKRMKKLLEQSVSETKSLAKKCLLERQTKVDLSQTDRSDIVATEHISQPETVTRPVLEPKTSDQEDAKISHHILEQEPSLLHDVRIAKLLEYLDSFHERPADPSSVRSERIELESKFGGGPNGGANSLAFIPSDNQELCSVICAVEESIWDIRFTREFKEQLCQLRGNFPLLSSLLVNLGRIAQGDHTSDILHDLSFEKLQIYETPFKSFNNKLSLIWQITPDYSPRIRGFTDTIRLWRICVDKNEVQSTLRFITDAHDYGKSSSIQRLLKGLCGYAVSRHRIPRNYDVVREVVVTSQDCCREILENDTDCLLFYPPALLSADSLTILKFYSLSSEVLSFLTSKFLSHSDPVPEFPFIPDDREDSLICMNQKEGESSILLVGRSGTGKTSIAVGRMWSKYKSWYLDRQAGLPNSYHQIFVTANRVLRDQVRKSFYSMNHGFNSSSKPPTEYPSSFKEIADGQFPLFLTQTEWLLMLDGTLSEPFFPRNLDGSLVHRIAGGFHEEVGMLDTLDDEFDEDDDWFQAEMEEEFGPSAASVGADFDGPAAKAKTRPGTSKTFRHEVDFNYFVYSMWPRIAASQRAMDARQLSASAVFQEVHSYIKGSRMALEKEAGHLSREEYLKLPTKMAPNFKGLSVAESMEDLPGDRRGTRDLIYDLFEAYETEKCRLGAYDVSDVVHHLWSRLQQEGYSGVPIHSILVDETQDFTQAELQLFIGVCADKNDLFFCGDTCQTIASGVGFRFEDLKSLFKAEQDRQKLIQVPCHGQPPAFVSIPRVNTLTLNYRTHNGILSAAAGIIDLLESFFPASIDILPREQGFFRGPKPVLLTETNIDDAAVLIVGSGKQTSQIEFGAHQVILVRNQESKNTLPNYFGGCLAMTILESKGLEFDDVFLWNFFADSKAEAEWRLVLSYLVQDSEVEQRVLEEERQRSRDCGGMLRPLVFCEHAHQLLCEELKNLYTAITRARVRVIIYDEDVKKRAPIFYYFQRRELVQILSFFAADNHAPMAVKTGPEEWLKQGINLKDNGLYLLAAKCFSKAGHRNLEIESEALYLSCQKKNDVFGRERQECFFKAGEMFLSIGLGIKAARCFYEAAEYELAGKTFLWSAKSREDENVRFAIGCYRKAGKMVKCVDSLLHHGKIRFVLRLLMEDNKFDRAIQILEDHPGIMLPKDLALDTFAKRAAIIHAAARDNAASRGDHLSAKAAEKKLLNVISKLPIDDELSYLRKYGFRQQLIDRLVQSRRVAEAATILCDNGQILEGAKLLDEMPDACPVDVALCSELYLAHAFSKQCDSKESSLLRAMAGHQKLIQIHEERLIEVQRKLADISLAADDLTREDSLSLKRIAAEEGVYEPVSDLISLNFKDYKLAELQQLAANLQIDGLVCCTKQEYMDGIELHQRTTLIMAILEKRRAFGVESAELLKSEKDQLTENVRLDKLHSLQIELELAHATTSSEQSRRDRLQNALLSSLTQECRLAEGLARFELILMNVGTESAFDIDSINDKIMEVKRTMVLFERIAKLVHPLQKGPESSEALRFEQFLGIKRKDGMCCISKIRKAMLDNWLDVGNCVAKADLLVVVQDKFKAALAIRVAQKISELFLLMRTFLLYKRNLPGMSTADRLQASVLLLWAVEGASGRLQQDKKLTSYELDGRVIRLLEDQMTVAQIVSPAQRLKICESIEEILCPPMDKMDCFDIIPTMNDVFPTDSKWKEEFHIAQGIFHKYIQSLQRKWESQDPLEKSAELLSKTLILLTRTLGEKFIKHVAHDLQMQGVRGWHPPIRNGYNAFRSLESALLNKHKRHYLSEAMCAVQYLELHIPHSIPLDCWSILERSLAEAVVVLSLTPSRGSASSNASGTKEYNEGASACFLPLSLARRFSGRRMIKKQVIFQDAEKAIYGAFRVIKKLVCHLAQLHGEEDCTVKAVKEQIGMSVWAALINFVIGLNSRAGLWERSWASTFQRDIEGMRLCSPILNFVPWDSRPRKLHKMTVFRPHIAMQPSDLALLCAKKGNPLVQVAPPQRGDQLVVTEESLDLTAAKLDKAFQDGLHMCIDPHAGSKSSGAVYWSPAPMQPVVEQNEESVWAESPLDQHLGSDAAKEDADEGEREDNSKAVDELEAERKAAKIVGRFSRYCIFRFAVARAAKEAQKVLERDGGEQDNGTLAILDPYQRSCRYNMLVEQKICIGNNIVRNGLYNMCGPNLVLDDSVPHYPPILAGLCRFRDLYSSWICKVLIRADLVGLELSRLAQLPLWRGNYERIIEIEGMQEALSIGVNSLETTLFVIDQRLLWPWAMQLIDSGQAARSEEPDIFARTHRLEAELLPQAIVLVNELCGQEAQLFLRESAGVQAAQGISNVPSLLPLGADCRARSYQDGLEYSGRIMAYTANGYLVEFQQDQAISSTNQQDTHRSDVIATSASALPRGRYEWVHPEESNAVGDEGCSSAVEQVRDEPDIAMESVVDTAEGLGWLEEEGGKCNKMRVRRFGRLGPKSKKKKMNDVVSGGERQHKGENELRGRVAPSEANTISGVRENEDSGRKETSLKVGGGPKLDQAGRSGSGRGGRGLMENDGAGTGRVIKNSGSGTVASGGGRGAKSKDPSSASTEELEQKRTP